MESRTEYGAGRNGIESEQVRLTADPLAAAYDSIAAGKDDPDALAVLQAAMGESLAQAQALTGADVAEWMRSDDPGAQDRARTAIRGLIEPAGALPQPIRMSTIKDTSARAWLIKDWLPRGRIGMLTAEGGFGKSRLALQVAAAMTTGGGEWLQRVLNKRMPNVTSGVVVFATWEDEPEECKRRIGHERAATMQDCHIVDLARFGPLWGVRTDQLANRGQLLPVGEWLRRFCEQTEADLLIVDSLAGAFGSNENDRAQVREFMADWDGWGRAVDCAVMLISHPSQAGQRQTGGYSGSTDWHGASRWRWSMETEGQDANKRQFLTLTKANYARDGARVYIKRGGQDKGFDWGEAGTHNHNRPGKGDGLTPEEERAGGF